MKNFPLPTDSAQALAFARAAVLLASLASVSSAQTTLVERDFSAPFSGRADAAPIDDMDGDNIADILVWSRGPQPFVTSSNPPFVRTVSGLTLETLQELPVPASWPGPMGATPVADRDGDGLRDIAIHSGYLAPAVGEVRIVSSATGQLLDFIQLPGVTRTFGASVLDLGDVNGDGISDLAVSEPERPVFQGVGMVHVLSGADNQPLYIALPKFPVQRQLGRYLLPLGDLDGDGVQDFSASVSTASSGAPPRGFSALSGATGNLIWVQIFGPSSGRSIALLDDMDGDGVADLAVASDGACISPLIPARLYILSGATGAVIASYLEPAGSIGCDNLSISRTADLDADGLADVCLGIRSADPGAGSTGRVAFLSSATAAVLGSLDGEVNSYYGMSVAHTADLNEDGVSEIIVGGSVGQTPGGDFPGYVSIVSPVDSIPLRLVDGSIQWDNSTGTYTTMGAFGSPAVLDNDVTLFARNMPPAAFGFFIAAPSPGALPTNIGYLLVSGPVGRFVGPGQIQQADATGRFSLQVDLTQWPTPAGLISVMVGETWYLQTWHRDSFGPGPTSRLSDRFDITFE